ncbi:MAG: bifunctional (p)ppGpp synthetase/guanosine-3',5'-bis(diphosphate) 3'-pyrophosphohydrolase [Saprospiraceae bacterium]|nr:RelA/SpoT family protein [Bacteroidia bacterium]NNE16338.1 bifunctional (p)ppGpp synthetase/guanosine-3',5'-bis(diphosphate) 3'-pyrophosphohydrolase [Saprospiraceae bacterium]NNL93928.1 bifunctional (p)ppGpp synthetase/guanosine-3',5'-bis(diphosphate) 3'-pyrophosphohydrolase [Saprospiraceae bacterium]
MPKGKAISKGEYLEIEKEFKSLLQKVKPKCNDEDIVHIKKAFDLIVDAHKYQRRKSGEPYVFHPIEVARICYEEIGLGATSIVSALLHDVVEDTDTTLEEIDEMFGPKIKRIVDGLTKLDGTYNVENKQAENFKKVLSSLVYDVRVVLIKMADRLHNLRTIDAMPKQKQIRIAAETSYIYTPLAHRLGLYNIKTEFNDICMKINEPDGYKEIASKLQKTESDRNTYIKEFIDPMTEKLNELDVDFRVLGRPKAISSIWNKIQVKQVPFEEIYDLFAVRIIVDVDVEKEKSICWQIYSIITDVYKPIPERLKDWITTPKSNGYESLHTTVIGPKGRYVEVQIRSERMDDIAERGFAAHWKYKGVKNNNNVYDKWLDNVRALLDTQHSDALEFLNDFKSNLFQKEVFVFTPTGDMRILPEGATALDFAFDIHSDVGYHATAIKVNNKLVPMGHVLNNGDQIQVTTNKNQKPSEHWLKLTVTGKARSKIRSAMKEEKRQKGEFGKEALFRKLKNAKFNFEDNIDFLVKSNGYNSRPDYYFALATGDIKMPDLKTYVVENNKLVDKKQPIAAQGNIETQGKQAPADLPVKESKKKPKVGSSNILIDGESLDQYEYSFALCCNPVQGDDIFGYLTSGKGLKIHRINCKNATHLLANYSYRVLKAEWAGQSQTNFITEISIIGVDSGPGVIQSITNELSNNLSINIRSFSIEGKEGYFEGKISVFVKNKDQLNLVLSSIGKLDGVESVTRIIKE